MRGLNVMYDFMRRPSMAFDANVLREIQEQQQQNQQTRATLNIPPGESPMTPLPMELENYEIDDEFNLPISVAFALLLGYMLFGASLFCFMEEEWTFLESFYFVFISISTIGKCVCVCEPQYIMNKHSFVCKLSIVSDHARKIQFSKKMDMKIKFYVSPAGFGDFVPSRPLYMMASILYLIFGLALTSMCINVVQVKLSNHFKTASGKIIGLQIAEATSLNSAPHSPTLDLQSVNSTNSIDNTGATATGVAAAAASPPTIIISDKNISKNNTNSNML
jgi:potassium channel subfamily K member 18